MNSKPLSSLLFIFFAMFIGLGTTKASRDSNGQSSHSGQRAFSLLFTAPDGILPFEDHFLINEDTLSDWLFSLDPNDTTTTPITTARYTITDLGTSFEYLYITDLNNEGQVVGYSCPFSCQAFVWSRNNGVIQLPALDATGFTKASGINDLGQVVGTSSMLDPYCGYLFEVAVRWQEGLPAFLGPPIQPPELCEDPLYQENNQSEAFDINDSGWVAGDVGYLSPHRAALWRNGERNVLSPPAGVYLLSADRINSSGQVIGTKFCPGIPFGSPCGAFLWQDGETTILDDDFYAHSINDLGQIVGTAGESSVGVSHAVLLEHGIMYDLGSLGGEGSSADGINNLGQVVGQAGTASGSAHAFVWQDDDRNGYPDPGEMRDLNNLIPPDSGWELFSARAINDLGQVAGFGDFSGEEHGFLLTPLVEMEITQGIQCYRWPPDPECPNNSVPLLAGKPTTIRAYVTSRTGVEQQIWGTLYADDGGGPVAIEAENAPALAVESHDRSNDRHALRFELPQTMWSGTPSIYVQVYADSAHTSPYATSNTMSLSFHDVTPLRIGYVPIEYLGVVPNPGRISHAQGYLERLYPLEHVDYFRVPVFEHYNGGGPSSPGVKAYLNKLSQFYDLYGWPPPNGKPQQLFGWVPDATWKLDGDSDPRWAGGAGRVAYSSDTPRSNVYQMAMAHEIGHNLGQCHPKCAFYIPGTCPYGGPSWPYNDYAIHDVGFNAWVYPKALVADTTDELMVGGWCGASVYDDKWISAYTFKGLYDTLTGPRQADVPGLSQLTTTAVAGEQPVLLVAGRVYTDTTAELDAAYQLTTTQTISQSVGVDYCLTLEDAGGNSLSSSCFALSFIDPESGITQSLASFVRVLPYDPAATRLVLKQGTSELAERVVSANPPTVTLLTPNGGETISGTVDVTWTADDADGDALSFAVSYSADGGESWYHLGVDITDTHLLIDTGVLPGSDQALFRVMATDGINTAYDVSDAACTIPRHGPEATILSPDDGTVIRVGQTLLLQGSGYDLEDGILAEDKLSWTSDLSGAVGYGRLLAVDTLRTGVHTITLTVVDNDGNMAGTTVNVVVEGYKTYLPLVVRRFP